MTQSPDESHTNHIDRADPEGKLRASIEPVLNVRSTLARALARALGMPLDPLDRMIELSSELRELLTAYERWAPLTQLGWAITDAASPEAYNRALHLLAGGEPEAAEKTLEISWNQEGKLEILASRVRRPATYSDIRISTGKARHRLVELAVEDHRAGRYHASIPVILAQTEGMLRDATGSSPFENPGQLVDDVSQGGHPEILKAIFGASRRRVKSTLLNSDAVFPLRHGILHGRLLNYANCRDSTKALVAMAEIATFCQARIWEAAESGALRELDRRVFGPQAETP